MLPFRRVYILFLLTLSEISAARAGRISAPLQARLRAAPHASVRVIAFLKPPLRATALRLDSRALVRSMQARARNSQASLRRDLARRGVRRLVSLWVVDAVAFEAKPDVAAAVAGRADIDLVVEDPVYQGTDLVRGGAPRGAESAPWNLERIGADALWAEGITGAGVTVGIIDTGVDAAHPDLAGRMAPNGFRDFVNNLSAPYDDLGHGTHVTGIICGGSMSGTAIGVAPGAHFLAAKALDSSNRFYGSWVMAAGQWLADPNGDGDPSDAPSVVNCSWTLDGTSTFYRPVLQLWRSVGIWPVFAAGNRGPGRYTVGAPGSDPLAIDVGMTNSADIVSDDSARGPAPTMSPFDEALKPDLVAPGVSIRSAVPGNAYGYWSGTSMASPHVAGALALLREAHPDLDFEGALVRLTATAHDLGAPGPDTAYGHGRLDVYAAVHMPDGYVPASLQGKVTDGTGNPLPNALVDASGSTATTGLDGRFLIPHVDVASTTVTADAPGFSPLTQSLSVGVDGLFALPAREEARLRNGSAEQTGGWETSGPPGGTARTDAVNRTPGGTWSLEASATGDGIERDWLSDAVPVPSGGLVTVNATYAWRGQGDASGRLSALVWLDGTGQVIRTDYGTPFYPPTRGGPADGSWRTQLQAFHALPPAEAVWVRMQLGSVFAPGDTTSRLWFDDAALDVVRASGTGAVTGVVTADGAVQAGTIVGEHPFGSHFVATDTDGRFVLVVPSGSAQISAWALDMLPTPSRSVVVATDTTTDSGDYVLTKAGRNASLTSLVTASSMLDGNSLPPRAADNDLASAWVSGLGEGTPDAPVWWSVDLGVPRAIQSLEMVWESEPEQVRVSVSGDGIAWTPVLSGLGQGFRQDGAHTLSIARLEGITARYLRVEDIGSNILGRMGLWEARVRVAPSTLPGDVDDSGVVDASDVITVLKTAGGLSLPGTLFSPGDLAPNPGDGRWTVADAVAVARIWAGL